ncbi:rRNA maturation RNase YbeY [Candidatus Neomarinimicrobiota bacterium]
MITINVDTRSGDPAPCSVDVVVGLASTTLSENGVNAGTVQIVFSDDEHLRQLKKQFLNLDQYTDVIAFHLNEPNEALDGEIYISPQRARENSQVYHETYTRELLRLVIHGCLHLSGYEDHTPEDQAKMRHLEDHFLELVTDQHGL